MRELPHPSCRTATRDLPYPIHHTTRDNSHTLTATPQREINHTLAAIPQRTTRAPCEIPFEIANFLPYLVLWVEEQKQQQQSVDCARLAYACPDLPTFPKAEAGPDHRVSLVVICAMEQEVLVCSRLQEPMHVQEEMIHGN